MRSRFTMLATAAGMTASLVTPAANASATPSPATSPAARANLSALANRIDRQLGTRTTGSYLDRETGKFVVDVTDDATARSVRAAGAVPRTVAHSAADLK